MKVNKKTDIKTELKPDGTVDVIVTVGKKEVFRKPKNKQTVELAHAIYMGYTYED